MLQVEGPKKVLAKNLRKVWRLRTVNEKTDIMIINLRNWTEDHSMHHPVKRI
jgi:hypothetical protein